MDSLYNSAAVLSMAGMLLQVCLLLRDLLSLIGAAHVNIVAAFLWPSLGDLDLT